MVYINYYVLYTVHHIWLSFMVTPQGVPWGEVVSLDIFSFIVQVGIHATITDQHFVNTCRCNYNFKSNHDSVSSHHDPYRLLSASPNSSYRLVFRNLLLGSYNLLEAPIQIWYRMYRFLYLGGHLLKSFPKVADPVTGTTGAKMPSVLKQPPPAEKLPTPVTDPVKAGVGSWRSEDLKTTPVKFYSSPVKIWWLDKF